MKLPKRLGTPNACSGIGTTINLCQRARDRLTWAKHVAKRLLKTDSGNSVLVRRAVALYTAHLEGLLSGRDPEQLEAEVLALDLAARGTRDALPEEDLIAVPMRAFSVIESDARREQAEKGREGIQALLRSGKLSLPHPGGPTTSPEDDGDF